MDEDSWLKSLYIEGKNYFDPRDFIKNPVKHLTSTDSLLIGACTAVLLYCCGVPDKMVKFADRHKPKGEAKPSSYVEKEINSAQITPRASPSK